MLRGQVTSMFVDQGWLRLMTDREVVGIGRGRGFAVVGCAPGQSTEIAEAPAFAGARAGGGVGPGSGPKLRLARLLKELYLGALKLTLAPLESF